MCMPWMVRGFLWKRLEASKTGENIVGKNFADFSILSLRNFRVQKNFVYTKSRKLGESKHKKGVPRAFRINANFPF